jgi:hypothetical protein
METTYITFSGERNRIQFPQMNKSKLKDDLVDQLPSRIEVNYFMNRFTYINLGFKSKSGNMLVTRFKYFNEILVLIKEYNIEPNSGGLRDMCIMQFLRKCFRYLCIQKRREEEQKELEPETGIMFWKIHKLITEYEIDIDFLRKVCVRQGSEKDNDIFNELFFEGATKNMNML